MANSNIRWYCKPFGGLSVRELFDALRLRADVFVVEQHCAYADPDALDQHSHHLFGYDGDRLAAYARIVPPAARFAEPSIGRVVTASTHRSSGIGRALMHRAIAETHLLHPLQSIRISAQHYLLAFYTSLGFTPCSAIYDEDGIPHIEMLLTYST
ncbi:MAG: GNAT family N-acetyltransferase [Candidatus Kapabacteria bacterium]|nr:GNAT family N-acetyltransferase [Candidatus Kapabacteria bacterium]